MSEGFKAGLYFALGTWFIYDGHSSDSWWLLAAGGIFLFTAGMCFTDAIREAIERA